MIKNDDSRLTLAAARSLPVIRSMGRSVCEMIRRHRFAAGYLILLLSIAPLLPSVGQWTQGDVSHYQNVAADMLAGNLPYRDSALEYPPYAVPFFLLPRIFGENDDYPMIFMGMVLLGDWLMKLSLMAIGLQKAKSLHFLLPLLFYALAVPALHFFYLQRYDIWPALICVVAVWLASSGRWGWSGLLVAVGIGVKLYPAVFVPPLFILAFRRSAANRFCCGLAVGILPILPLSFFLPWWRFAEFQSSRGLQVESIYASILWLGKFFGFANVHWAWARAWFEVQGPSASAVLPWARAMFATAVAGSTAFSVWMATRVPLSFGNRDVVEVNATPISLIARLLLIPLLVFVAFNQVLSPQYMIWLLPLVAIASLKGNLWPVVTIPLATLLTPWFFPTAEYATGLNLTQTLVLLFRNFMLIAAWILLVREMLKRASAPQTRVRQLPQ